MLRYMLKNITKHREKSRRTTKVNELCKKYDIHYKKSKKDPIHIIFIVIDSLRADHLSLFGYHRDTTPFLKEIAEQAAVFSNTISASCWTYPSVASILSGFYPHNHGGVYVKEPRNFDEGVMPQKVNEEILYISEILQHFGFESFFASAIAFAEFVALGRFQHIFARDKEPAQSIIQRYIRWINKRRNTNTFAYIHLGDVHEPVRVPKPYWQIFGHLEEFPKLEYWGVYHNISTLEDEKFQRFRENRIKLYDAGIRYIDAQIKYLFDNLRALSIIDGDFLIIITADHGEEFWEHVRLEKEYFYDPRPWYGISHGHHLFQEVIHVPLLVLGNNINGHRYDNLVSTVDIVPTVLDYIGINVDRLNFDGQNLFHKTSKRTIIAESTAYGYEKKAIIQNEWKLYVSKGDQITWLFNLDKDPKESTPVNIPEIERKLMSYWPEKTCLNSSPRKADAEVLKRLRELGYLGKK